MSCSSVGDDGNPVATVCDKDAFVVWLESGKEYNLKGEGSGNDPSSLLVVRVYNEYNTEVTRFYRGDTNNDRILDFSPTNNGYHTAVILGYAGTYTMTLIDIVADGNESSTTDLPADSTTTGRVDVGDSSFGEIESKTDVDWFAVELVSGKSYRIEMKGKSGSDYTNGSLDYTALEKLRDPDGDQISGTGDPNTGQRQGP